MPEKTYHHHDLKRTLIEASLGLIRERGPAGFTLREVARRAGVSHTAPYRHFEDKTALLAAVVEQGFTDLRRALAASAVGVKSPRERLLASGRAYVEFALAHAAHFEVMFSIVLDPARHPDASAAADRAFQYLLETVKACQVAGDIQRGDPIEPARVAWAMVHGVASLVTRNQLRMKRHKEVLVFAAHAASTLMTGLAGKSSRSKD